MNKTGKMKTSTAFFVGVGLMVLIGALVYFGFGVGRDTATGGASSAAIKTAPDLNTQCAQNPAYTYSAVDAFAAGTTVGGTDQIKNGQDAPVSSLASPAAGKSLSYWKNNGTYFCEIIATNAACGSNTVQSNCYQNGTMTLSVRDLDNDVTLTAGGGATNVTFDANEVHNLEVRSQSASKKSTMPFGGCVAVEYPSTITDIAINGAGIDTSKACAFPWTYAVSSTSNTYKLFAVPDGFDKDGTGQLKRISLQMKSGATNPSGTAYVTFQPANYYVGNDKQFYLGIEKDKNADTTKTMAGGMSTSFVLN